MRDESVDTTCVSGVDQNSTVQALLALALLHQKVTPSSALKRNGTASGLPETLLGAAVGLELGHLS